MSGRLLASPFRGTHTLKTGFSRRPGSQRSSTPCAVPCQCLGSGDVRSSTPPPSTPETTVRWLRPSKTTGLRSDELFADVLTPLPSNSRQKELVDQLVLLYDGTMISAQLDWRPKPLRSAKQRRHDCSKTRPPPRLWRHQKDIDHAEHPPTGTSDLERLRAGDEANLHRCGRTAPRCNDAVARSFVPSYAVAQEVVQDTWLAVLRGMDGFEERSSFQTWLYTILINRARSAGIHEHRHVPIGDPGVQCGPLSV